MSYVYLCVNLWCCGVGVRRNLFIGDKWPSLFVLTQITVPPFTHPPPPHSLTLSPHNYYFLPAQLFSLLSSSTTSIPTLLGVPLDSWDPSWPAETTRHILQPRQKQTVHIPVGGTSHYCQAFSSLRASPLVLYCKWWKAEWGGPGNYSINNLLFSDTWQYIFVTVRGRV